MILLQIVDQTVYLLVVFYKIEVPEELSFDFMMNKFRGVYFEDLLSACNKKVIFDI